MFFQQLIASIAHIVAKNITYEMPPSAVLFFRVSIASIIYATIVASRRRYIMRIERKDIFTLIILSLINIPINQYLFFKSISYTTAPNVALAYAITPVFVFILSISFFNEKPTLLKIIGMLIALLGVTIILSERGINMQSDYFIGNIIALAASFSWALYTVIGKSFSMKYGAIYSNALTSIIGLFIFMPIFLILPESQDLKEPTSNQWLQLFYLASMTSVVSYILWYYALKKYEATKVSVFSNMQPILTTALAVLFLNQEISVIFILGGFTTIFGVFITQKG